MQDNTTEKFIIALSMCYPGVQLWVADGQLQTDYVGDDAKDRAAFLACMSKLIMEHCKK